MNLGLQTITPGDNPEIGRCIINSNFLILSSGSTSTILVQGAGSNSIIQNNLSNDAQGASAVVFGSANSGESAYSFIGGGAINVVSGSSSGAAIIGSAGSSIENSSIYSTIIAGQSNLITNSEQASIIGNVGNVINTSFGCAIIGAQTSSITGNSATSVIIGGISNSISAANNTVVLGGSGILATKSNTVYVPNLVVVTSYTPTGSFDSNGAPGSISFDTSYIYWRVGSEWFRAAGATWNLCMVRGTKILLSNGKYKNIEDVTYEDGLMVWNFDEGKFDEAQPLWIKTPEISEEYNLLKFSDGSELKIIGQHRIFNVDRGLFTYPMTDETPIGTTTFNSKGDKIKLVNKEVVHETVEYYNVITDGHMNLFGNGILTSCRYNNIYPVVNMKFVKDDRTMRSRREFKGISDKFYYGLRLNEQQFGVEDIEWYIKRLIKKEDDIKSYENRFKKKIKQQLELA